MSVELIDQEIGIEKPTAESIKKLLVPDNGKITVRDALFAAKEASIAAILGIQIDFGDRITIINEIVEECHFPSLREFWNSYVNDDKSRQIPQVEAEIVTAVGYMLGKMQRYQ